MRRIFTPEEANRTLPLVRGIVRDILDCGQAIRSSTLPMEDLPTRTLRTKLRGLISELQGIGCEYKDWQFARGLVDFPGRLDGRPVFFCWRGDEARITHYHAVDEGFLGRRRIPASLLSPAILSSASPSAFPAESACCGAIALSLNRLPRGEVTTPR